MRTLIQNRKARFNYIIENDIEAGMCLNGHIVKSIYAGQFSISGAYLFFKDNRPYLVNCNCKDESVKIPLLLNKKEIKKIQKYMSESGKTLVPLRIYSGNRQYLKCQLGFSKGRRKQDKREYNKEKDAKKQMINL